MRVGGHVSAAFQNIKCYKWLSEVGSRHEIKLFHHFTPCGQISSTNKRRKRKTPYKDGRLVGGLCEERDWIIALTDYLYYVTVPVTLCRFCD